jgi:hypothetical protein
MMLLHFARVRRRRSDHRQMGAVPPPGERGRLDAPFAAIEQSVSDVTVERRDGYHLIGCGTVV